MFLFFILLFFFVLEFPSKLHAERLVAVIDDTFIFHYLDVSKSIFAYRATTALNLTSKEEILNILTSPKRFFHDSMLENVSQISTNSNGNVFQLKYLTANFWVW